MTLKALRTETSEVWISVAVSAFRPPASELFCTVGTMTLLTRQDIVGTTQTEGPKIMVLTNVDSPISDGVTPRTVRTTLAIVGVNVAILAFHGHADVRVQRVAFGAVYFGVLPLQWILGLSAVIELREWRPVLG